MNVCRNCGKEYEGKYCPECGTRYDRRPVRCKNCGCEFVGRFCPECGERYEPAGVCPKCGAEVTSRFCPDCGTRYAPFSPQTGKAPSDTEISGSAAFAEDFGEVSLPGAKKSEARICKTCGTAVEGRFCPVCGAEYGVNKICRRCGNTYAGSFCPSCGAKDTSRERGQRTYLGISRSICTLFLTFAVLFVIACTAMPWEKTTRSSYSLLALDGRNDNYGGVLFLFYFSIGTAVIALFVCIAGLANGGRKMGQISSYQSVGIVGVILMFVGLVAAINEGSVIRSDYIGSGAVCAMVFSAVFLVATIWLLGVSSSYPKKNPAYLDALESERRKLAKRHPEWK